MKIIARNQENITLNPYEFILNEKGEVKEFETDNDAVSYLNQKLGVVQNKEEWDNQGIYIVNFNDYFDA